MKVISSDTPKAPLNTHAVAYGGLFLAAVGIFGPLVMDHFIPTGNWHDAIHNFGKLIASVGTGATYLGRPGNIPQS